MKYGMQSLPFLSRKTYDEIVKWWSRSTYDGQIKLSELAYKIAPTGEFHAKEVTAITDSRSPIADVRYSKTYLAIETPDDISNVRVDDIVMFRGIVCRVDSKSRRTISKTREFMKSPLSVFVLQLER